VHAQLSYSIIERGHGHHQIQFVNDSCGFELTNPALFRTTNFGISWTSANFEYAFIFPSLDGNWRGYNSIFFTSPSNGYSYGGRVVYQIGTHLYHGADLSQSKDSGDTWSLIKEDGEGSGASNLFGFIGSRDEIGYYGRSHPLGLGPNAFREVFDHHGNPVLNPDYKYGYNISITSIDRNNDSIVLASNVSGGQNILKTSDGGKTIKTGGVAGSIHFIDGSRWLNANSIQLYESKDNGDTWDTLFSIANTDFKCIRHKFCYLLSHDYYLESPDSGYTWHARSLPEAYHNWALIHPIDSNAIWVEGETALLHISGYHAGATPVLNSPRILDFGTVPISTRRSITVTARNVGDTILQVDSLSTPMQRVTVSPPKFSLQPNDSVQLTFSYFIDSSNSESFPIGLVSNTTVGLEQFLIKGTREGAAVEGNAASKQQLSILPSIASESVSVTIAGAPLENIQIFDELGRPLTPSIHKDQIDIRGFPTGVFYVQATSNAKQFSGKFVKE
jgi:hypothetical protein